MPRVIINKHQYKSDDIGNRVSIWLRRSGKKRKDLANELAVSYQGIRHKLENNVFTYSDMLTIFDYLDVPDEEILQVMKL